MTPVEISIFDRAMDSIFALPRQEQKKLTDFMAKFRSNSRDPSLHLEPISTFKDPQMRTARLSQKYRVIIHAPTEGTQYHILHIGNHDEAMAWAENKVFEWNDLTDSFQVYSSEEATARAVEEVAGPQVQSMEEEQGFGNQTDDELVALGVPRILLPSIRQIQQLDQLEALYDYLPIEALENLSLLLEGAAYDTILREVNAGRADADATLDKAQSPNNRRSFFEITDDETLNEVLAAGLERWRLFLHPTQRQLVEGNYHGPTKVTGGAGTGKTVAALHRAITLQNRGAATRDQPILFTTFTKSLKRNLAETLRQMGADPGLIHVDHVDHFVVSHARELGLITDEDRLLDLPNAQKSVEIWREVLDFNPSEYDAVFLDDEYQDIILHHDISTAAEYYRVSRRGRLRRLGRRERIAVYRLIQAYENHKAAGRMVDRYELYNRLARHYRTAGTFPYRHVIADELQDFTNVHLRLLRSLVAEQSDDLFLVGDPLQRIYPGRVVFTEAGINVRGRRSRRLRINYRTTDRIRRVAAALVQDQEIPDFDGGLATTDGYVSLRAGEVPTYESFADREAEAAAVWQRLRGYLYPKEGEQAIRPSDICLATRTNALLKSYRNDLHQRGVAYQNNTGGRLDGNPDGVYLSTFHNLKGLEFKIVFLLDVSTDTVPFRPAAYRSWTPAERRLHDTREWSLLYVAMTRGIARVHLYGVGDKIFEG